MLAMGLLALLAFSCGEKKEEAAPPAGAEKVQTASKPVKSAKTESWTFSEQPGDSIIGWSKDGRAFAFRRISEDENGEWIVSLHVLGAAGGKLRLKDRGVLLVSSRSLRFPPKKPDPRKAAPPKADEEKPALTLDEARSKALALFHQRARKVLERHGFVGTGNLGRVLYDAETASAKAGPGDASLPLKLNAERMARLTLRNVHNENEKPDPSAPGAGRSAPALDLQLILDAGSDRERPRQLGHPKRFLPDTRGFRLRAAYLAPERNGLAVLVERLPETGPPVLLGAATLIASENPSTLRKPGSRPEAPEKGKTGLRPFNKRNFNRMKERIQKRMREMQNRKSGKAGEKSAAPGTPESTKPAGKTETGKP